VVCESSFWSVDRADSIWDLLLVLYSTKESLRYLENHVGEQCLVICVG